jgi:hypothetical protein
MSKVVNPLTNRKITVGGALHKKLCKNVKVKIAGCPEDKKKKKKKKKAKTKKTIKIKVVGKLGRTDAKRKADKRLKNKVKKYGEAYATTMPKELHELMYSYYDMPTIDEIYKKNRKAKNQRAEPGDVIEGYYKIRDADDNNVSKDYFYKVISVDDDGVNVRRIIAEPTEVKGGYDVKYYLNNLKDKKIKIKMEDLYEQDEDGQDISAGNLDITRTLYLMKMRGKKAFSMFVDEYSVHGEGSSMFE